MAKGTRCVALLRGINVGKAKRIAMADLRALVEALGYGDVKTLLNSGNVVFTTSTAPAKAALAIERALASELGHEIRVTVLTKGDVDALIAENPLADIADNHSRLMASIVTDPADLKKLAPLVGRSWASESLALGARAAFWWCPDGVLDSALGAAVAKALRDGVTTRNWATMLKLQALLSPDTGKG